MCVCVQGDVELPEVPDEQLPEIQEKEPGVYSLYTLQHTRRLMYEHDQYHVRRANFHSFLLTFNITEYPCISVCSGTSYHSQPELNNLLVYFISSGPVCINLKRLTLKTSLNANENVLLKSHLNQ